jgi:4-amino-4-deoxy-L-arabinose transferase-like glycosyltransferase
MTGSWHDFLFASMDKAGLMTNDKPPLAYWIQALVVRGLGHNAWSLRPCRHRGSYISAAGA